MLLNRGDNNGRTLIKVAEHSFDKQTNMAAKKQWYTEDDFSKCTH